MHSLRPSSPTLLVGEATLVVLRIATDLQALGRVVPLAIATLPCAAHLVSQKCLFLFTKGDRRCLGLDIADFTFAHADIFCALSRASGFILLALDRVVPLS